MLRVVTWNVNSISVRLERLLALLKRWNPDVVLLQELKCPDEKFPYSPIQEVGYHAAVLGQKTYNGVAILSKKPLTEIQCGMGDFYSDSAARLIRGKLGEITFICCYVPNGQEVGCEKYQYKMNWLQGFHELVKEMRSRGEDMIIAGDFNIAPDDRDVHDPTAWKEKILCSTAEREALKRILGLGFSDTFRKHHQDHGLFSWWDYRALGFQKNQGLRIDLILATPPLLEACSKSFIDRDERKGEKPSDHAPMISDIGTPFL